MGKIIITTNASLDGVVQDPDGQEGFKHGGWFTRSGGADLAAWTRHETDETLRAEALLLGRRSDEWFATRWAARTGEWADKLNSMPKYVVSSTAGQAQWGNGTVLTGDLVSEVSKLKQQVAGEILVYASYQLGHALIEHDLVDQLRLMVYPVVAGAGKRLFEDISDTKRLRLVGTRTVGENLASLTYDVDGAY